MKKIISVLLLVLMVGLVFGDQITLISGETIEGEIKGKSQDKIYIYSQTLSRFIRIENDKISSIVDDTNNDITKDILQKENFNNGIDFGNVYDLESRFEPKTMKRSNKFYSESAIQKNTYKFKLFPFATGIALIALAVDSYSEASDLSKAIKDLEKIEGKTSELKKDRSRKNVVGTICMISSLISFTASFEQIEIQASPTSVSLGYRF